MRIFGFLDQKRSKTIQILSQNFDCYGVIKAVLVIVNLLTWHRFWYWHWHWITKITQRRPRNGNRSRRRNIIGGLDCTKFRPNF